MAATAEAEFDNDVWDQETMMELRRFAFEQALIAHIHRRDTPVDLDAEAVRHVGDARYVVS